MPKQQGTETGRFVISTVAGDGPDLTDLILEDIEKFTSLIVCISSKVKSEKSFTASWATTPEHSFSGKATMFGQLA